MTEFTITENFPKNEIEFDQRFSDPKACYQYLFEQKWPDGFTCKKCGHTKYWVSARNLYICTQCEHTHSLTTGTIMDSTNLKELLGFGSYGTAWSWLQKLRRCTIRQGRSKLAGRVEVDEFSSAAKNQAKEAAVLKAKQSYLLL